MDNADNYQQSILYFIRSSKDDKQKLICICNSTTVTYYDYHLGVPDAGSYKEVFNSDSLEFGGSGQVMTADIFTSPQSSHGFEQRVIIKIPPMATLVLKLIK